MPFLMWVFAFLKRVPPWAWVALAAACLLLYGRSHYIGVGEDRCRAAQEAAEKKADAKAIKAGARADKAADAASATIRKETDHAADRARVIVREVTRDCPLPPMPDELRDLGDAAVERARRALPAG